jgi:hypothetical protein
MLTLLLTLAAAPQTLLERFPTPPGFSRVEAPPGSFAAWLRGLPLAPEGSPVRAFDGRIILDGDDPRLAAVATLDVGTKDLQQCADTAIRLHAEWLFERGRALEIVHHLTNGDLVPFSRWASGERPALVHKHLVWSKTARADASHEALRRYLDFVFLYAGTLSLATEGRPVGREAVRGGDVFVTANPKGTGHAVIILDVAVDEAGHRVALLGQGYMPAQSLHVLRIPRGAWFSLDGETIETPFWAPFPWASLRRLPP